MLEARNENQARVCLRMKDKLSRIRSPWRRLMISLVLSALVAMDQAHSPRKRVHWIGSPARPRRLERVFFIVVLFAAMLTFDAHQYVIWSLAWGSAASLFVILNTLYKLAQRFTAPLTNSEPQ